MAKRRLYILQISSRLLKYLIFLYHDSTSKCIIMFNKKLTIWHDKISSNTNFIGITIWGDNWHICLDTTTMITLCLASFFKVNLPRVIGNNGPLCHGSLKIFMLVFLYLIYNHWINNLLLITCDVCYLFQMYHKCYMVEITTLISTLR